MHDYRYDHVHLRSPDPDATARFFENMFGAEVKRSVYPPGTLYPGQQRITMRLGDPGRILLRRRLSITGAAGVLRREKLAQDPNVDLVTVSVKLPDHYLPVMAAIEAGKHVYCECRSAATPMKLRKCSLRQRAEEYATRSGCRARCHRRSVTPKTHCRGLCRPRPVGDDDWLRSELGTNDRSCLPGRFR